MQKSFLMPLTSARALCDWKNTASLWPHLKRQSASQSLPHLPTQQRRGRATLPPEYQLSAHFWHGWSSVRGNVGSWDTSAMIWVSSLREHRANN